MDKKIGKTIILGLNLAGIICLLYYAIPYILHDMTVPDPEAMLPLQKWDASGIVLTVGLLPLIIANTLGYCFIGAGKGKKVLRLLFFAPCVIALSIVAHYWISGIGDMIRNEKALEPAVPMIKVQVQSKDTLDIQYCLFYEDGGMEILDEPFKAEVDVEVLTADVNNFSSELKNHKTVNTLASTTLQDSHGKEVEADDIAKGALQAVASTVSHEIMEVKIFEKDQRCFAAVKTNVNWQDPCDFYSYDADDGKLELLCNEWDDVDVLWVVFME